MTVIAARRAIWAALVLLAPVPIAIFGPGAIPVARIAMLAAIGGALMVVESAAGGVWLIVGVLAGQALLGGAVLWVVAWLVSRGLAPLSPGARAAVVAIGIGAALILAGTVQVYRAPFAAERSRVTLFEVYR